MNDFGAPSTEIKNWTTTYGSELDRAKLALADQSIELDDFSYFGRHRVEEETITALRQGNIFVEDANWTTVNELAYVWDSLQLLRMGQGCTPESRYLANYSVVQFDRYIAWQSSPVVQDILSCLKHIVLGDDRILALLLDAYRKSDNAHQKD